MNLPLALGVLWTMLKEPKSKDIFDLALKFDAVFGLNLKDAHENLEEVNKDIPEDILALAQKRFDAKKAKDFATADALRNEIKEKGYSILDSKDGFKVVKD